MNDARSCRRCSNPFFCTPTSRRVMCKKCLKQPTDPTLYTPQYDGLAGEYEFNRARENNEPE